MHFRNDPSGDFFDAQLGSIEEWNARLFKNPFCGLDFSRALTQGSILRIP
jgi:hypothetical protein